MANPHLQELVAPVDPAFAYQPGGKLQAMPGSEPASVWRHLSSQIARDPLDLESHVRRVSLAADGGEPGQAFTAMVDLFLALGPKGRGLRSMLIRHAEKALTPEELDYLRAALDSGLSPGMDLPLGVHAALDPGLMNGTAMVRHSRAAAAERSLVEQAGELLDHGDIEAARRLLEEALMQSPEDEAVSKELMAIYRHTRDTQAVAAMRDRLAERHGRVPAAWV
jgi:hypothetical protein